MTPESCQGHRLLQVAAALSNLQFSLSSQVSSIFLCLLTDTWEVSAVCMSSGGIMFTPCEWNPLDLGWPDASAIS